MAALQLRIRTESSEQQSYQGSEYYALEHSFQSVNFVDDSVGLYMRNLHQNLQNSHNRHMVSSRSHSYILVDQHQQQEKPKYKSMKKGFLQSLDIVNKQVMNQLLGYHRCLNLAKNDIYNRAYGAMFGFLIGDSMGAYLVNVPYCQKQINAALLMRGGGVMNLKSGECTDEWQICCALSQALIEGNGLYDQNIVASKYLEWLESQPFDLPVLMGISFSEIRRKRRAGKMDNKSIGEQLLIGSLRNMKQESNLGLIRLIPLVIWSLQLEDYQFERLIAEEMKLITPNQFVSESAIVYANMLRCIIKTGDHTLAYHQAAQHVCNFGSQQMAELWEYIEQSLEIKMNTFTAQKLHFPFVYAVNQMLEVDKNKDMKKQFIDSSVRVISKGHNTDTNASIVLGMVGAIIGYNNIPSFFKNKIINSNSTHRKNRAKDFSSQKVIGIVEQLLSNGAKQYF